MKRYFLALALAILAGLIALAIPAPGTPGSGLKVEDGAINLTSSPPLVKTAGVQAVGYDYYIPLTRNLVPQNGRSTLGDGTHRRRVDDCDPAPGVECTATAYYVKNGRLVSATTDIPRFDDDGLMLEAGATNHVAHSWNLDDGTYWAAPTAITLDDNTLGPDAGTTAYGLISSNANSWHGVRTNYEWNRPLGENEGLYTLSVIAKAGVSPWMSFIAHIADAAETKLNGDHKVFFNLAAGTPGTATGASDYGIEPIGNGWYKVWGSFWVPVNSAKNRFYVQTCEDDNDDTFIGDGVSIGCYVANYQFEKGPRPTSPIYTSGVSNSRAPEDGYPRWDLPSDLFAESLSDEELSENGFETWPLTAWDNGYNCTWTVPADPVSGTSCVQIEPTGAGGYCVLRHDSVSLTAGKTYKLTSTAKKVTATSYGYAIYHGIHGYLLSVSGFTDAAYNQRSFYFTAPTTSATYKVYLMSWGAAGTTSRFDDVSLTEVTNAWDGMPPHGTLVAWIKPSYDLTEDDEAYTYDLIDELIYRIPAAANRTLYTSDGTTAPNVTPGASTENEWIRIAVKWGYLDSNLPKYNIGCDMGSGFSWGGSEETMDGGFDMTDIRLFIDGFNRWHFGAIAIDTHILTDKQIEAVPRAP